MSVLPALVACSLVDLTAVPQRRKPQIASMHLAAPLTARFYVKTDQAVRANGLPFPLLHHLRELFEQVMRIVRSGRGFRVILHAEQRQVPVAQAFESLVVQVDVGQFDLAVG